MKSWYKSKTIWFNLLTILTVVATYMGYTPDQDLATQTSSILLAVGPLANLALRFVTKTSVSK